MKKTLSILIERSLMFCAAAKGAESSQWDVFETSFKSTTAISRETLAILISACAKKPAMPVRCGETCYEGHMQQGFGDVQRHIFTKGAVNLPPHSLTIVKVPLK